MKIQGIINPESPFLNSNDNVSFEGFEPVIPELQAQDEAFFDSLDPAYELETTEDDEE